MDNVSVFMINPMHPTATFLHQLQTNLSAGTGYQNLMVYTLIIFLAVLNYYVVRLKKDYREWEHKT